MKNLPGLLAIAVGCIAVFLLFASQPSPKVIEIPGPEVEKVIHDPPDTARIESLEARLKVVEAERDAALDGWRKAYAAWEQCSRAKSAPQVHNGGGQGSPSGLLRRRFGR